MTNKLGKSSICRLLAQQPSYHRLQSPGGACRTAFSGVHKKTNAHGAIQVKVLLRSRKIRCHLQVANFVLQMLQNSIVPSLLGEGRGIYLWLRIDSELFCLFLLRAQDDRVKDVYLHL